MILDTGNPRYLADQHCWLPVYCENGVLTQNVSDKKLNYYVPTLSLIDVRDDQIIDKIQLSII